MQPIPRKPTSRRYSGVAAGKASGSTYTPDAMARFVAARIVANLDLSARSSISLLDPALGDGQLTLNLLAAITARSDIAIAVHGFDTNAAALGQAANRIRAEYPAVAVSLRQRNFLEFVLARQAGTAASPRLASADARRFDVIVANPPYVRVGDRRGLQPEVREEPEVALYGGPDGVETIERFVRQVPGRLKPGGYFIFEFGFG